MRCPVTRQVDAHFAGQIEPAGEVQLRAHLEGCDACRRRYERHLLLSAVDPGALPFDERIGRGLGFRRRRRLSAWPTFAVAAAAVAVAAVVLVAWPQPDEQSAFRARGGGTTRRAAAARLVAYRLVEGRKASRLGSTIGPRDALAFAYLNRAALRFLLVYAVDDKGRTYWYHPAWKDPSRDPRAVPIKRCVDLCELPEAISHEFTGVRLSLASVFANRPLSVKQVERLLRSHRPGKLPIDGAVQTLQRLEVRR